MLIDANFQLPIAFLEQKSALEEHTINDLELLPTETNDSLYKHVLNPDTLFGEKNIPLWSKYYTADITFLQESQKLLKSKCGAHSEALSGAHSEAHSEAARASEAARDRASMQVKINDIWQEITNETGFAEKYSYVEWSRLAELNHSSKFLQCLSIYNMASPIFSLMLPIFFLIVPLVLIKLRGLDISVEKYIELLKMVCKKHQLGQIFDLANASLEKIIYVIATAVFYVIQIYQNIMSCRKFYQNMAKIHEQLFITRDYLASTLENMDLIQAQCNGLKSYDPFIGNMCIHRTSCQRMLADLKQIHPNNLTVKKFWQIGHTMQCFYQLYRNTDFHMNLQYTFGFNGYIDNLNGIRQNIALKQMNNCKFKKNKTTKFVNAYFPVNEQPVKNTYKLDKHLLITGPNAAGKTTLLKTTIFNIIISQQVGYGFYKKATIAPYDMIHCYINIPDTSARDSLFQAEAKRCKDILTKIETGAGANASAGAGAGANASAGAGANATALRHFCVFDELYSGTNPYEAISSAYAFLKYLHNYDNVNFVITTHFLDLCRRLEKEKRMHNYHMKIETLNDDFKYTYKMEKGISEIKGGIKVLKDLEYPSEIINMTSLILKDLII